MSSPYGRCQAFRYARTMSKYGVQIISGLARELMRKGIKVLWKRIHQPLQCLEAVWMYVIHLPTNGCISVFWKKEGESSVSCHVEPHPELDVSRKEQDHQRGFPMLSLWLRQS